MRVNESDGVRRRVRAAASVAFLLLAQVKKLALSSSLAWAVGALKCHTRKSYDGAGIRVLSVSAAFLVISSVLVVFGRSCSWQNCDYGRYNFYGGATAGLRCAMVRRRGLRWCSCRQSLRFTIHRISRGRGTNSKTDAGCLGDIGRVWLFDVNVCINSSISNHSYSKDVFFTSFPFGLYLISFTPL